LHAPPANQELSAPVEEILGLTLHPKVRTLVDYWLSIKPAGSLPGRQHFEPLDVPALLPNIWLIDVEREPKLRLRYRLVGTNVAQAFDRDSTGRYLDEVHSEFLDSHIWLYMKGVVQDGMPGWRAGTPRFWHLRDYLSLERIYLPLASDGREVDMILALTVFVDRFGNEF
jgi:hypothetical protein